MDKSSGISQETSCELSETQNVSNEALASKTRQLLKRFLREFTRVPKSRGNESEALWTMKRVVDDMLNKNDCAFKDMINTVSLDDRGDDFTFVSEIANGLFADGTTNWCRIASLAAFGAALCQYWKQKGRDDLAEPVGEEISGYLLTYQKGWLVTNSSWEGFVKFFGPAEKESVLSKTLVIFAGFAGVGATLAFFCM